jgi:hypothetical protein
MSIISDALRKAQSRHSKKSETEGAADATDAEVLAMLEGAQKTSARSPKRPFLLVGIILIFLLFSGVLFLMPFLRSLKPAQSKPATSRVTAPAPAPKIPAAAIKKEEHVPAQKKDETPYYRHEAPSDLPALSGIMYSPVNPQAIVEGELVSEGETVRGYKIKKILPDKIKVTTGGEEYELKLR